MPTEYSVNKRDIHFVLFEQLQMDRLCELPAFRHCDREQFELVLNEAIKNSHGGIGAFERLGRSRRLPVR